jgi:hypothetical protein
MTTLQQFFTQTSPELAALSHFLDSLEPAERLQQVRVLTAPQQARLFDTAAGFHPVQLTDFVPAGTAPLQEVIHYGRNSLPIFHFFEKRFCLPPTTTEELWGYNEWRFRSLTGPGYFVARQANELEVVIDYYLLPQDKPPDWPPIRPNSTGLSRFIYYQMRDFLRGVSRHVSIGRATRGGKPLDNWFVLCRNESEWMRL